MVLPIPSISLTKKLSMRKALAFSLDRCYHLAFCLQLILFHCSKVIPVFYLTLALSKFILQYLWLQQSTNDHGCIHRHLSNIDCLTACTACLVCFISTVNGHSKEKRKKAKNVALVGGHITNMKQSIFFF